MWENFEAKSFQQALISNGLKIICKVLRGIYNSLVGGVDSLPFGINREDS
jgi:hypothetical protein